MAPASGSAVPESSEVFAATGAPLFTVRGAGVAFSPDGRRAASAGGGALREVDAATGAVVALHGGGGQVTTPFAWSPDGQYAADGGGGHTARVWARWPLSTEETVAHADMAALRRLTPAERGAVFLDPAVPRPSCRQPRNATGWPPTRLIRTGRRRASPMARSTGCAPARHAARRLRRHPSTCGGGSSSAGRSIGGGIWWRRCGVAGGGGGRLRSGDVGERAEIPIRHAGRGGWRARGRVVPPGRGGGLRARSRQPGLAYQYGWAGLARDEAEGLRWLERGAARGDADGHRLLGLRAETAAPYDPEGALLHYAVAKRLLQEQGVPDQFGVLYRAGALARSLDAPSVVRIGREAAAWTPAP